MWREIGRVGGGKHVKQRIRAMWESLVFWDGDRLRPGGRVILCRDILVEGVSGQEGDPPRKDIRRREEREGRFK